MSLAKNLSQCQVMYTRDCGFQADTEESKTLSSCKETVTDFKKLAGSCYKDFTSCTCWSWLEEKIFQVKKCTGKSNIPCFKIPF